MTEQKNLYTGASMAAWGYFFLYIDINLGRLNILPAFVGILLFMRAIALLKGERRDLELLRPLGVLLVAWHTAEWALQLVGVTLEGRLEILSLIVVLVSLYFHFQLLTDLAALAEKYQQPGEGLARWLLTWRSIQTIMLTALALLRCMAGFLALWWEYILIAVAIVQLIAGLCLMLALFSLRKIFLRP